MKGKGFEEIEHTADVALLVWGKDLKELFINAARGTASLLANPETIEPTREVRLKLTAHDAETLLVTWLGELLFYNETEGLVFTEFDLDRLTPTELEGAARGGLPGETRRHIKAVTFHQMEIRSINGGLETTIVFDV